MAVFWTITAAAADVTGHVRTMGGSAQSIKIVYAEPENDHSLPKAGHYTIQQRGKTFVPHVLAIPVGSTVSFPNSDPIFHNVFSLSRPQPFDLGLYRAGDSKSRVYTVPATYRVFCNIHPQMTALILVLPTAYIAQADSSGSFHLNLPAGPYRLTAWSEKAEPVTIDIKVDADAVSVPDLTLDESKFVEITHKNKYGQEYPRNAYDPNAR